MAKNQVIITIGHTQILLPDDTGAAAAVKTLSRGISGYHFSSRNEFRADKICLPSLAYVGDLLVAVEDDAPAEVQTLVAAIAPRHPRKRSTHTKPNR